MDWVFGFLVVAAVLWWFKFVFTQPLGGPGGRYNRDPHEGPDGSGWGE